MTRAITLMKQPELDAIVCEDDAGFGSISTARGHLPLEAMDVATKITALIYRTRLRQEFVNTFEEPLEATYMFPLPDRAAVTRFRLKVGERVTEGIIKERGAARREYNQAIASGHRAAITEEERAGVFTLRVGNLMPGERASVELTFTGALAVDAGEASYRFPLVVAPRYIPGKPLSGDNVGDGAANDTDQVPDASRITPPVLLSGYPNPVRLSLSLELDPGSIPVGDLRCSLHSVITSPDSGSSTRIELQPGERLNRDFIARFSVGDDAVRSALTCVPDDGGKGGTFELTLVPPASSATDLRPRDVVFVLDRSGSMQGWKMVAARRAVGRMVDTLNERDRFTVLAFDNTIETPPTFTGNQLATANNRNRFRAIEFLAKLDARGGTEMYQPLTEGFRELAGGYADRDRVLVLVTDGQVGNEDQILRGLSGLIKNVRVFTLGIDRAVNEAFLRRLADLGGGLSELVESEDRLDDVMDKVHRRIGRPVVSEVAMNASGLSIESDSVVPARLPDLFPGAPLVIRGRYSGDCIGSITVTGRDQGGAPFRESLNATESRCDALPSIWARAMVRKLEDQYAVSGDSRLVERIVSTSVGFSVLSRFTAFVAVDRSEVANKTGDVHRVVQPVDAPEGWDMLEQAKTHTGVFGRARGMVSRAFSKSAPMPPGAASPPPPMAMPAPAASAPMDSLSVQRLQAQEEIADADDAFDEGGDFEVAKSMAMPPRSAGYRGAPGPSRPSPKKKRDKAEKMVTNRYSRREEQPDVVAEGFRTRLSELVARLRSVSTPVDGRFAELIRELRKIITDMNAVAASAELAGKLTLLVRKLESEQSGGITATTLDEALSATLAAAGLDVAQVPAQGDRSSRSEFWK